MCGSRREDIRPRLVRPGHEPHSVRIVFGVTPVFDPMKIPQLQPAFRPSLNCNQAPNDLLGDENRLATWRFVVVENRGRSMETLFDAKIFCQLARGYFRKSVDGL